MTNGILRRVYGIILTGENNYVKKTFLFAIGIDCLHRRVGVPQT